MAEQALKYRVAGALIVMMSLFLAWILLLRFDEKRIQAEIGQPLPRAIIIDTFEVPDQFGGSIGKTSTGLVESELSAMDNAPEVELQPEVSSAYNLSSGLDKKGLPIAYVLQVASFQDQLNAEKLRAQLIKDKHNAYIKRLPHHTHYTYRVFVGPKMNKPSADALSKQIFLKYKLQSLVVKFKPGYVE